MPFKYTLIFSKHTSFSEIPEPVLVITLNYQMVGIEGKNLRLSESEVTDLWQSEWNEKHVESMLWPYITQTGIQIHWNVWWWGAESGVECCWSWADSQRRQEGGHMWWEVPLEESQAALRARHYRWVRCRLWNHHWSLSLPTHWHWKLTNRERRQWGWYFEHLSHWAVEKNPSQGCPLSASCAKQ